MDRRKIIIAFLIFVALIFYTNNIKVKIGAGLDSLKHLENNMAPDREEEVWEEVQSYLDLVAKRVKPSMDFFLFGYERGYEKVSAHTGAYIPFYMNGNIKVIQEVVPLSNTYIRPGRNRTKTKYIVIHNTGAAAPAATADLMSRSINNSVRQASWHFTVDDRNVYQQLDINEVGWHAGSKEGNEYGIGIELCVYKGIDFNSALRNTAKLTAELLIKYNLGFDAVKQHYDFSGKNCPQVIREAGRWEEFIGLVEIEYYGMTKFADIHFRWIPKNPSCLTEEGYMGANVEKVRYEVEAVYKHKKRKYEFSILVK